MKGVCNNSPRLKHNKQTYYLGGESRGSIYDVNPKPIAVSAAAR